MAMSLDELDETIKEELFPEIVENIFAGSADMKSDSDILDELNRVTKEEIFPRVVANVFGKKVLEAPQKEFRLPISYRKSSGDMVMFGANGSAAIITNVAPPEPSLPTVQPLRVSRRITFEDET